MYSPLIKKKEKILILTKLKKYRPLLPDSDTYKRGLWLVFTIAILLFLYLRKLHKVDSKKI